MDKYRKIRLDNKQKTTCPSCGHRRTFTPYVYADTRTPVDATACGICDRLDKCHYHCPPREYFKDHPEASGRAGRTTDRGRSRLLSILGGTIGTVVRPASAIDAAMVEATLRRDRGSNPLYRYLMTLYTGIDDIGRHIDAVFDRYRVGTSTRWGGSAIFWMINGDGSVPDGKIMGFDPVTGRRVKKPYPQVNWVSSLTADKDRDTPRRTYFGAHVAAALPDATIMVVESEKTALQLALVMEWLYHDNPWHRGRYVVIASGGCDGLSFDDPVKTAVLRGRRVVLIPDQGKYEAWCAKADELTARGICPEVRVTDMLEKYADQFEPGYDIEDVIARCIADGGRDAPWHLLVPPERPMYQQRYGVGMIYELIA